MKIRPFNRKSRLEQVLDGLSDIDAPSVGSSKATKTGLIAAGSIAGLTAVSAGISSLRRRNEGTQSKS